MSILAGRSAGKEAAFFFEESKEAVGRLAEKLPKNSKSPGPAVEAEAEAAAADVLPEVLQHSLPPKLFQTTSTSSSSSSSTLSTSAKWALGYSTASTATVSVSPDVLNPLRGFVSLPQVSFGPKRWQLPPPPLAANSAIASTANNLRHHTTHAHLNPHKLTASAQALAHIGKAFAVATAIVFGSAALSFGFVASKLDLHTSDDIRTKGKDFVHPKFESLKDKLSPLKDWAENTSKKWHLKNEQDIKERPIIKELSKILRTKNSA